MSKKKNKQQIVGEEDELTPKKKKVNSRGKGHNYERQLVLIFKAMGFPYCKTTRYGNRLLDDCKVDIMDGPQFNIQAKNGYWNARPKYEVIMKEMKAHLDSNFPPGNPQRDYPRVIFHKLDGLHDENQMVIMTSKDWFNLLKDSIELKKLKEIK